VHIISELLHLQNEVTAIGDE